MSRSFLRVVWIHVLTFWLLAVVGCGEVRLGRDACWACDGSVGLAPNPLETPEALVHIYGARTYKWHGIFAVHTWVAYKPEQATGYTVLYMVKMWHKPGVAIIRIHEDIHPDRRWHGAAPELLYELRGLEAETSIPKIREAVKAYPPRYHVWPGPNSNTFIAHIVREVPELKADLPPRLLARIIFLTAQLPHGLQAAQGSNCPFGACSASF